MIAKLAGHHIYIMRESDSSVVHRVIYHMVLSVSLVLAVQLVPTQVNLRVRIVIQPVLHARVLAQENIVQNVLIHT